MRHTFWIAILVFASFIFLPSAHAEFCNWGFAGPQIHKCDGETYYRGSPACESGHYPDLFCHEKFSDNGKLCAQDNSPETMACLDNLVKPTKEQKLPSCNWGWAGTTTFECGGKSYSFGTAVCSSGGHYPNVFCRSELTKSGAECAADNAPETVHCYNKFVKVRLFSDKAHKKTEPVNQERIQR